MAQGRISWRRKGQADWRGEKIEGVPGKAGFLSEERDGIILKLVVSSKVT